MGGSRGVISEIMNGKREITKDQTNDITREQLIL